jgi:hypothetical protein
MRRITVAAIAKKCERLCQSTSLYASQSKIGFMDQRGGLQRVVGAFSAKIVRGQTPQLRVDERN